MWGCVSKLLRLFCIILYFEVTEFTKLSPIVLFLCYKAPDEDAGYKQLLLFIIVKENSMHVYLFLERLELSCCT